MSMLLPEASVVVMRIGRGWASLSLCWHSKWSGVKLHTGFFLGAGLDRKTQREARRPCGG